jgi:hypothetical protein
MRRGYYAGTRHRGRHSEAEPPQGLECIAVLEAPGAIEWIGMAVAAGPAAAERALYVIHLRDHERELPGVWALVEGQFQPRE